MTGSGCRAWLLPFGEGRHAAIGEYELVHIIPDWVRLQSIPLCPVHCHKVFMWQGQLIPVFDPQAWFRPQDTSAADATQDIIPIMCIVAYEDDKRTVGYGGIMLSALPFRTTVLDDQLCDYPDDNDRWSAIAVSCFSDSVGGQAPVLDLPRIFCSSL